MQCLNFIDALAGVATFPIEVLVGVRDCTRVDIEARLPSINGGEPRTCRALHANRDPGLQDAVSGYNDVLLRIDDRLVQRVSHGPYHAVGRSTRKLSIGIEREDKSNFWQHGEVANLDWEAVLLGSQQLVQIQQLATLAFPTHPSVFATIKSAMAMQQKE